MRSSDQIFTYLNASAVLRPTKPEIFMSLSLSVLSQSGPPKSVGGGGSGGSYTTLQLVNILYRGGNFFFFFFSNLG